jgi:hypothetical protein
VRDVGTTLLRDEILLFEIVNNNNNNNNNILQQHLRPGFNFAILVRFEAFTAVS